MAGRTARVYVTLKQGVLDPQGKAVGSALRTLGYSEVVDVRLGKMIEVTLAEGAAPAEARQRLEAMCKKLLANTVIEDFLIEV
jgi:phosphoribosylformylglycinamidine synthase